MAELSFPKRPYRTKGGVHAPHNKNTAHKESVMMPVPAVVALPMTHTNFRTRAAKKYNDSRRNFL